MSLQTGSRLGPYDITGPLGAGGMGEVYRARDSKLERDVAIKVLPAAFTADRERLSRFEREARVLASLNHPHIAQIYGFEQAGDVRALVLELVEGETLEDRIQRGRLGSSGKSALPVAEALTVALEIADALDAAHEKGIVHRDLKPANVKVTPAGVVKVLDFGLARTGTNVPEAQVTSAATVSAPTMEGRLLGTVPYMSPQQARGQAVDKRTDIWAFGCVLYEMLTGDRPFRGETTPDLLAAIVGRDPDWSLLPETTPPAIQRLLRRCLEKDLRRRMRDIGDAHREIEETLAGTTPPVPTAAVATRRSRAWWPGGVLALAMLAALTGWLLGRRPIPEVAAAPVRLSILFLERPRTHVVGVRHLAISEDGSRVAYASSNRLWIRRMDRDDAVALGGSGSNPFFSPDEEWVGVFHGDGSLFKVPTDGGPPLPIANTTDRPAGATWRADGTVVFATTEGLHQVSADGGDPRLLVAPDRPRGERLYAWPHFLPDGRSVLFTVLFEDSATAPQIASLDLETLGSAIVLTGGTDARYVPTGHLVYASGPALKAIGFDPATRRVRGAPVSLPGVQVATAADNGAANFAVSATGTLVFAPASSAGTVTADGRSMGSTLYWVDREGKQERLAIKPGNLAHPRISPNGDRVALDVIAHGNRDIWILDLARLSLTQLTDGPTEDLMPEWSGDGSRVFFASDRTGNFDVYSQAADGAMGPKVELTAPGFQAPLPLTPDGKQLLVYDLFKDVGVLTLGQPDRLEPLLDGDADERLAEVSPDGRWVVYESDESGTQFEIFVRPFPNTSDRRHKISVDGGRYARFSLDGDEIFYVDLDGNMMAAAITLSPSLELGPVTKLFSWRQPTAGRSPWPYALSPLDGRFLMTGMEEEGQDGPTQVSVVLNWFSELTRLAPAR